MAVRPTVELVDPPPPFSPGMVIKVKPTLTEGAKFDNGKLRWDLLPMDSLEEITKVYTAGSIKYDSWNWSKGILYSRLCAAMLRHWVAWWWFKKDYDEETKCHHLSSVAWYVLTFLHYELNKGKYENFDDRY